MKNIELRVSKIEMRSNEDNSLTVSGYVNMTEKFSEVLGQSKRFIEKISKGAFSRAIKNAKSDIHFLAEHNAKQILSSTRNGSLKLTEDQNGLFMEATIVNTTYGADYFKLIDSGILQNMSFGFTTTRDSWKSTASGIYERTIEELELFEVSVVRDPAYSQSTISARGINLVTEVEIPTNIAQKEEKKIMEKTEHRYGSKDPIIEQRDNELEQFRSFLEERDMQGTTNGTATIGEAVHDGIVRKMEQVSPIFAMAKKFPSVSGTLKIPRETAFSDSVGFVGEGQSVEELSLGLEEITLGQKRVGASIRVSNQLINDAAINTVAYVQELLGKRTVTAVEKSMLTGNTADQFRGMVHDVTVPNFTIGATPTTDERLNTLLDLYLSVHPEYQAGAVYIMSRSYFNEVSKLKDKNGQFYLLNGVANGRPTKTLFGAEVLVSQSLDQGNLVGQVPVVFGNIEQSYAVMIKQGPQLQMVVDTDNALKGATGFVFDAYLDGQVYNNQAISKLSIV